MNELIKVNETINQNSHQSYPHSSLMFLYNQILMIKHFSVSDFVTLLLMTEL